MSARDLAQEVRPDYRNDLERELRNDSHVMVDTPRAFQMGAEILRAMASSSRRQFAEIAISPQDTLTSFGQRLLTGLGVGAYEGPQSFENSEVAILVLRSRSQMARSSGRSRRSVISAHR